MESGLSRPVFTKRITHTADFSIDGQERELYDAVTRFVKRESARAAAQGRRPARPCNRLSYVALPEAPGIQHLLYAPLPGETAQRALRRASSRPKTSHVPRRRTSRTGMTLRSWRTTTGSAWSVCLRP